MIQFFKRLAAEVEDPSVGSVLFFVDENGVPSVKDENGILVPIQGEVLLSELQDVNIPTPLDGQVLTYDGTNSVWIAADSTGGGAEDALLLGGNTEAATVTFGTTDAQEVRMIRENKTVFQTTTGLLTGLVSTITKFLTDVSLPTPIINVVESFAFTGTDINDGTGKQLFIASDLEIAGRMFFINNLVVTQANRSREEFYDSLANPATGEFADKGEVSKVYATQITTDDTPVTIAASAGGIKAEIIVGAKQQGLNNRAAFEFRAYNAASLVEAVNSNIDAALAGISATILPNGDIEVTGLAATTIKWNVYTKNYAIDDNFPA